MSPIFILNISLQVAEDDMKFDDMILEAAKSIANATASLIKAASEALGGKGGGGRADMAQAGGPDGDKCAAALEAIEAELAG